MKTILLVIVIIFMHSNASFSQVISDCNPGGCSTPFTSSSTTFTMPGFPGCTITVYFLHRICNGKEEVEIQTIGYNNPPDIGCTSFLTWLYDPLYTVDHVNQLWWTAEEEAAKFLFLGYYNSLPPTSKFLLQCPNGYYNYDFYKSACNHYCGYTDNYHNKLQIVQLACSTSICCKIEYKICWNTTTQQMDVVKTTTRIGGTISCPTTPPVCPSTYPVPGAFLTGQLPDPMESTGFSTPCVAGCE